MRVRAAWLPLVSTLLAAPLAAQVPAGPEFRPHGYTIGFQAGSSVAVDRYGNFVVVWQSDAQDGSGLGVFARRYDAAGLPRGSEFRVNTYTTGHQGYLDVAADPEGNLVVVWASPSQDGSGSGVFGQRYDAAGAPLASEFRVNSYTPGDQTRPRVTSNASRSVVVTWSSEGQDGADRGIFAQVYGPSGDARGAEFQVNTLTAGDQTPGGIASDASGNFIVTWLGPDTGGPGLLATFARRYDPSGAPRGPAFKVNPFVTAWEMALPQDVTSDPAGNFVVVWLLAQYIPPAGPALGGGGVFVRRYDSAGAPQGDPLVVHPFSESASVASDAAGNFVVVWDRAFDGGDVFGVAGQRFDASGSARGAPFQLNTFTPNAQSGSSVASDPAGNFVAAWNSNYQDGSGWSVAARRFGGIQPAAMAADTVASGSDGNGVVEPGESVDLRPAWRNVNGAAQTFNGGGSSFAGPPASGVSYTLPDASGLYGTVANGATAVCVDCYRVTTTFGGTRPAVHWDATFTERLTPDALGQTMPWSVHVGQSFTDVPKTSPYYRDVETLLHRRVTGGCASALYCPANSTTREQLAAFVLLAKEGAGYVPAPCSPPNLFADVPETSIFCDVIEELARRGVVAGCGGGNYCPSSAVSREQMAVFTLRTLDPALDPPACSTPVFADVPASSPFCRWIEELARRGVVAGCGGGNYCPTAPLTREQMAVFLSGTFGLTLYGP